MTGTRIVWNESESRAVAVRWIQICEDRGENPLAPRGWGTTALDAQLVLEEHRRRDVKSLSGRAALQKVLDAIQAIQTERKESAKVLEIVEKRRKDNEQRERAERVAAETVARAQIGPKQIPDIPGLAEAGASLEQLVQIVGQTVSTILVNEFRKAMKQAFTEEFPKLHTRTLAVAKMLPKILVCGPLPKQQPILEQAVDGVADLKFVSSEENPKLVNLRGKNCVAAVIWTNYVSHGHQEAAKSTLGKESVLLVSGGIDSLKSKVEETALMAQIPEEV